MKKYLFTILIIINIFSQETLKLNDAINIGLERNYNIKIAESKLKEIEATYNEISAQFYPKLQFSAGYTRLNEVDPFQIILPILPNPITIQESILNNYSFKTTISQPIFTGFKLSSQKKSTEYLKNAFSNDFEYEKNNVIYEIISAYYNYVKAIKTKILFEKRLGSINNYYENTKNYFSNGLATKSDILRMEVLLTDVEVKLVEAKYKIDLTKNILFKQMSIELDSELQIDTTFNYNKEDYIEQEIINEALTKRLEIKSIEQLILSNYENTKVASSDLYPTINAYASFSYDNPNQRYMPLKNKFNESWIVGINLNWEIWNWGASSAKQEKALQKEIQTGLSKNKLIDNIKNEVKNNFYEYNMNIKKIDLYNLQSIQAEENLREIKTKYDEQIASVTELTDAETILLEAQIKLVIAKAENEILKARLNKSLGRKLY